MDPRWAAMQIFPKSIELPVSQGPILKWTCKVFQKQVESDKKKMDKGCRSAIRRSSGELCFGRFVHHPSREGEGGRERKSDRKKEIRGAYRVGQLKPGLSLSSQFK